MTRRLSDKRIADWLETSSANFYRWLAIGLLPQRPTSQEEAKEMLRKIDLARDNATRKRPKGLVGRTTLAAIVTEMEALK